VYVQVLFLKVHTHFYLLYTLDIDIWKGYVLNYSMFPCMCYICLFPCLELSKHPNCLHKPKIFRNEQVGKAVSSAVSVVCCDPLLCLSVEQLRHGSQLHTFNVNSFDTAMMIGSSV